MIVVIPLGGVGKRFSDKGFDVPKALIPVLGKPIITYLLDNLNISDDTTVIIPYHPSYEGVLETFLTDRYPNISFFFHKLSSDTLGAAHTVAIGLQEFSRKQEVSLDEPFITIDADNFYTTDILREWNNRNCVFTFHSTTDIPRFSYVKHERGVITHIVEKSKISNDASCGAYGFDSSSRFCDRVKVSIQNSLFEKELYVSTIIAQLLDDGRSFSHVQVPNKDYFSLGTPEQVKEYEQTYLFDLDGTLICTDPVYTKVWDELLKPYGLECDEDFFNSFIRGNADAGVMRYLVDNIDEAILTNISHEKDSLFRRYISELKNDGQLDLYEGVISFFQKIQK